MTYSGSEKVAIIIVNYRTGELVVNCLESLKCICNESVNVFVVDNCSGDNSVQLIGDWISNNHNTYLICSEKNLGFSGGNNLAIEYVKKTGFIAEFFWLLNPDTLVFQSSLQYLLLFLKKNSQVGITGSRLVYPDGKCQSSAFRFHTVFSELDNGLRLGIISKLLNNWQVSFPISEENICVDWVSGASMLVRKQLFDDVGLFDDGYFLYFEETDFCLQAKKSGWSCWHIPNSKVIHFAGASTEIRNGSRKRLPCYWFQSRKRYFLKNHGKKYLFLVNVVWSISFSLFRIRQKIQNKQDDSPSYLLRDFVYFNFFNKYF